MRNRDGIKMKAIRNKAMELIVHEGFDGLSMHKLAKLAGVSVATIYIYYKDREDLILSLCREETTRMSEVFLQDFDPSMSLEDGLRNQWTNRAHFWLNNPIEAQFIERMRHSPYHDLTRSSLHKNFTDGMHAFVKNAIRKKELKKMPLEVFWCVAYSPLYQLIKFHMDGYAFPGGAPIKITRKLLDQALQLVVKGLTA